MQYVTVYQNVNFLSVNKKFKNDNTIQLNPQLIMTIQALVFKVIDLLCAYNHSFSVLCKIFQCGNCSKWPDSAPLILCTYVKKAFGRLRATFTGCLKFRRSQSFMESSPDKNTTRQFIIVY